jgi:NAD-dependent DNA ligase
MNEKTKTTKTTQPITKEIPEQADSEEQDIAESENEQQQDQPDQAEKEDSKSKINPKQTVVVVTGTMSTPKRDFMAMLSGHGFQISNILHRRVDYLIAGPDALEKNTQKVRKARKYSVPIVTEKVFFFLHLNLILFDIPFFY